MEDLLKDRQNVSKIVRCDS